MAASREYVIECDHVTGDVWSPAYLFVDESVAHEVVRCRDCRMFDGGWCEMGEFAVPHMDGGYCAWGIRKEQR